MRNKEIEHFASINPTDRPSHIHLRRAVCFYLLPLFSGTLIVHRIFKSNTLLGIAKHIGIPAIVFTLLLGLPLQALAQWKNRSVTLPFTNDSVNGALIVKTDRALTVRCINGNRLEIVFAPNEKVKKKFVRNANKVGAKIIIQIDRAPVVGFPAVLTRRKKMLFAIASLPPATVEKLAKAKHRIAVALTILNYRIGATSFGVSGSERTIDHVLKACHVEERP